MAELQARGSASQILIDFETVYGADPETPAGISIPYHFPVDLKQTRPLKASTVHRPNRNPASPFYDNRDVKGSITVPVDQINLGYWLRALLGAPQTAAPATEYLDNAPAVDKVGDYVGIPITGHPFLAGEKVTIAGTTNYNGTFEIYSKTANEIVIPALYVEETFAGTETCTAEYYTHIFKPASAIESLVIDAGYNNVSQYFKFNGCKLSSLALDFGGAGNELMAKLGITGAKETRSGSPYDADPDAYTLSKFQNRQLSFEEGGGAYAEIKNGSLTIANDLDEDSFLANGDTRFALPEGDVLVNGKLSVFFPGEAGEALYDKAVAGTESSLKILLTSGLYSLAFLFPELLYTVDSPHMVKGGVYADLNFQGYYENAAEAAAVVATLINDHSAYV
jgi:hypothetical protein